MFFIISFIHSLYYFTFYPISCYHQFPLYLLFTNSPSSPPSLSYKPSFIPYLTFLSLFHYFSHISSPSLLFCTSFPSYCFPSLIFLLSYFLLFSACSLLFSSPNLLSTPYLLFYHFLLLFFPFSICIIGVSMERKKERERNRNIQIDR